MSAEQRHTEEQVARLQATEARYILETLLKSLEAVQKQRRVSSQPGQRMTVPAVRAQGEVIGLQVAIDAIKRRLR